MTAEERLSIQEGELRKLRREVRLYRGFHRAWFYILRQVVFGRRLDRSARRYFGRATPSSPFPARESADLAFSLVRWFARVGLIGFVAFLAANLPVFYLMNAQNAKLERQNRLIERQNEYFREQTGKIQEQIEVSRAQDRAERRSELRRILLETDPSTGQLRYGLTLREDAMRSLSEMSDAPISLANADLSDMNLSYMDLRNANFRSVNMMNSTLHASDLSGSRLGGNLRYVDLAYAKLEGAEVGGDLFKADLQGANLRGATIRGSFLDSMLLSADLSGATVATNLASADLGWVGLANADLRFAEGLSTDLLAGTCGDETTLPPYYTAVPATWSDPSHLEECRNIQTEAERKRNNLVGTWEGMRPGRLAPLRAGSEDTVSGTPPPTDPRARGHR